MVVGQQGPLDRGAQLPVEPHPCGQGQQPLRDPDPDPLGGVRAVAFQAELVHLVTHFREEAASPEVAELLKARYVDYLAEHADERRFDR